MKNKRRLIIMVSSMLVILMAAGLFGSSNKSLVDAFSGNTTPVDPAPSDFPGTPQATIPNTGSPTSTTPITSISGTPVPTLGAILPSPVATPLPTPDLGDSIIDTPTPTPTEIPEYFEANVVIVKVNTLNVRSGPSTSSSVTGKIYNGCYATVVEDCGDWYKVNSGQLKEQYLYKEYTYSGYEAAALVDNKKGCEGVVLKTTNIRQGPSISEDYTRVANRGNKFSVILTESTEDWICVELDSTTYGYIKADDISLSFNIDTGLTNEQIRKNTFAYQLEQALLSNKNLPEDKLVTTNRFTNGTLGSRYDFFKNYQMSSLERDFFAAVIQAEVGWHPYSGKLAAANVIVNRLLHGGYGNTITAILTSRYQFSGADQFMTNWTVNPSKVNAYIPRIKADCYRAVDEAMAGLNNIPTNYLYFQATSAAHSAARGYPVLHFEHFTYIGDTYFHSNWYSK